MNAFEGTVAVVTGGGAGIGEALCDELASRGAHVVVVDIHEKDAVQVAGRIIEHGGKAHALRADVSNEAEIRHLIEETTSSYGRLDYLFNNAGIAIGGDARDLTVEQWRQIIDVDFLGVLYGTLAAYPIMVRQGFGHIVNTSSATGLFPQPINAPYCASKHAVVGLTLSLRMEGADLGVRFSVICPGRVRTSIFENTVTVNVPQDQLNARMPRKMLSATKASEVILDGVSRNQALIVFPASIRWAWRAYRLFPRALERIALPRVRQIRKLRVVPERR